MYKIFVSGLTGGPMVALSTQPNKAAAMDSILRFLALTTEKCTFFAIADPDSGESDFSCDSIPVIEERAADLAKKGDHVEKVRS